MELQRREQYRPFDPDPTSAAGGTLSRSGRDDQVDSDDQLSGDPQVLGIQPLVEACETSLEVIAQV